MSQPVRNDRPCLLTKVGSVGRDGSTRADHIVTFFVTRVRLITACYESGHDWMRDVYSAVHGMRRALQPGSGRGRRARYHGAACRQRARRARLQVEHGRAWEALERADSAMVAARRAMGRQNMELISISFNALVINSAETLSVQLQSPLFLPPPCSVIRLVWPQAYPT